VLMLSTACKLAGVRLWVPERFTDSRGVFCETYNEQTLAEHGITDRFVQDNEVYSEHTGTLRGLHWQDPPHAQAKLVRCVSGCIVDVVVDLRRDSDTFGQWQSVELSAEIGEQLYVPEGFAHGYITRAPETRVAYKCSRVYTPIAERAVRWDDPTLAIDWGVSAPRLSERDANAPLWADVVAALDLSPEAEGTSRGLGQ
jgi:dTDP-4-dehydrorhamnose 3,5-epimerase